MSGHWTESPSYLVDAIAEAFWPTDPDRDGPEAQGLKDYYAQADALINPSQAQLVELAKSLPNTRKVS